MAPFDGTIQSDYLKLVNIPDDKKPDFINYAATDFLTIRSALIDYIKAVYPLDYQNFSESDLGMMLIELVSYMGSVLSMKADMLANENFLRTAKNRNNVKKLLELIGVNMKGPISSAANARLTLDTPSTSQQITLSPANRVITISSPEDSGPLNFTLYKVVNGALDVANSTGDIVLDVSDSVNSASAVWSNLAMLEGSLVVETGSFTSPDSIKKLTLSKNPVVERSVNFFLTGNLDGSGVWDQVDNLFFASGVNDQIFQVVYDDNFNATILFGDGIIGRSPPINSSYLITYRIGGGTRGNIKNSLINANIQTDEGLSGRVENVSQATGGRDAETVEHAKKYAPLTFRRQDRLVTLEDYSTFANTFIGSTGSTGKAKAVTRDAYSSGNILDIFVLQVANSFQLQQATTSYKQELLNAINQKKMFGDEIVIADGLIRALDLVITIRVDKNLLPKEEQIKADVRDATLNFFNVDNTDFGKTLVLAELNRTVFNVPEVRYSTVDNLSDDVVLDFNEIIQLNNLIINVVGV